MPIGSRKYNSELSNIKQQLLSIGLATLLLHQIGGSKERHDATSKVRPRRQLAQYSVVDASGKEALKIVQSWTQLHRS